MARRNAPHNDHSYRDAVGGIVPGYGGHRPEAVNVHGESAFGNVPVGTLTPGQGWSVDRRDTTAFQTVGAEYKHRSMDKAEVFREVVGGVKSGYHGHVPGAQNHIGSAHVGGVPLHDFRGPELDRPQYHPRDPRWQTESSRQGPRGQIGGNDVHLDLRSATSPGISGTAPPLTPPPLAHRTPPASQRHAGLPESYTGPTPRGGQPPRNALPPGSELPTVGYAGHRKGERELADESIRGHVEAYNGSRPDSLRGPAYADLSASPPAGRRDRPTVVGSRSASPPAHSQHQYQQAMARAQSPPPSRQQTPPHTPKAAYVYSPPTPGGSGSGRSGGGGGGGGGGNRTPPASRRYLALAESQTQDYHAHQHGAKAMDRSTPRHLTAQPQPVGQRPGQREAFIASSRQQQSMAQGQGYSPPPSVPTSSRRGTPRAVEGNWHTPSWDHLRSTPQDEIYRSNVGGVKLGYSGHIPDRSGNVGSSNYGNSLEHVAQRDHGTRIHYEPAQADHMISGKASASAVGYAGHAPTNRDAVGTSYWQAAAGGAEPRFAGRSQDMRDLLSA
jgi:hypothetical protein